MRVLITGGAGFIGSSLALALLKRNCEVTVLDNLSKQVHGEDSENSALYHSIKNRVQFIKGDVTNKADFRKALIGNEIVVHLAAETGTGQSMYEIEKYIKVNVLGTAIMLDLITNDPLVKIKKMVVASSRSIYGEGKYFCKSHGDILYPEARLESDMKRGDFELKCTATGENLILMATDEESKIHPSSIYGITKQHQEQMVLTTGKALKIPAVAFRYQNVYGPGQSLSNPYTGILSIFSTQIKNGRDINIFEDGKESRDFVYIDDVINATILGIENDNADFKVYNVGSGKPIDVFTVAKKLVEKYNRHVNVKITGNYRMGDIRHNFADLSLIKRDLGFEPQVDFDRGLSNFVQWVDSQDIKESHYEKSLEEMKVKGLYK